MKLKQLILRLPYFKLMTSVSLILIVVPFFFTEHKEAALLILGGCLLLFLTVFGKILYNDYMAICQ